MKSLWSSGTLHFVLVVFLLCLFRYINWSNCFFLLAGTICIFQWDSNLNDQSKRWASWPQDYHHFLFCDFPAQNKLYLKLSSNRPSVLKETTLRKHCFIQNIKRLFFCGFVCAYHPAAAGLNPKHTIKNIKEKKIKILFFRLRLPWLFRRI